MNENIERRVFAIADLRAVKDGADGMPTLRGHAAVFDSLSENLGGFREKIAPGAFKRALSEGQDVRALINHDSSLMLGRTTSKTLRLAEDKTGLAIEVDTPDTTSARDLVTLIDRGDISQMSFGFMTRKDQWELDHDKDEVIRTLIDVDLFDVSAVTFPAYPQTDIALRSLEAWRAAQPVDMGRALKSLRDSATEVRALLVTRVDELVEAELVDGAELVEAMARAADMGAGLVRRFLDGGTAILPLGAAEAFFAVLDGAEAYQAPSEAVIEAGIAARAALRSEFEPGGDAAAATIAEAVRRSTIIPGSEPDPWAAQKRKFEITRRRVI